MLVGLVLRRRGRGGGRRWCSTLPERPKQNNRTKQPKAKDMANNFKGAGTRFSSTYQPENRGRKKSLFRQLVEGWGDDPNTPKPSREDIQKMMLFLMERTAKEIKEIGEDENTPIWVKSIIVAIVEDMKNGRVTTINTLFDRVFGKPSQTAEIDAKLNFRGSIPIRKWIEKNIEK